MGLLAYLAFVAAVLLLGALVRVFDPSGLAQIARKTGLSARQGWAVYTAATLWMFLPVLFGADVGDDSRLWVVGPALAGTGIYLATMAVTARDEYRLLTATPHRDPGAVRPDDDAVATAGVPEVADSEAATAPFTGEPSVHTDWLLQRYERTGTRKHWANVATGVESVPFALGDGAVVVESGRHRTFTGVERRTAVDADEPVPEPAAAFLRADPDLPDPEKREHRLRFQEELLPAGEPVTVVGVPEQGEHPGTTRIATAPPDDLLGTHAGGDGDASEPVLVQGDADDAERQLRRRVYWLGIGGAALALVGQLLGFALSSATLPVP